MKPSLLSTPHAAFSMQLGYNSWHVSIAAFESLIGAHLRRLDSPASDVLALSFSGQAGERVLLVRFRGSPLGLGLVAERPRGAPATATVTRFRHHLQGARLLAIESLGAAAICLFWERAQRHLQLEILASAKAGNCVLRDAETPRSLMQWHQQTTPATGQAKLELPTNHEHSIELGAKISRSLQVSTFDPAMQAVALAIERRVRSLQRRAQAIAQDLARVELVPSLRNDANLLLTYIRNPVDAEGNIEVLDISVDPPQARTLRLVPKCPPQQQAEQWFARARKLERGATIAQARAALTADEIFQLHGLQAELNGRLDAEDLARIIEDARRLGVAGLVSGRRPTQKGESARQPFHEYRSVDGQRLLVGRGAKDNDALTLHVAQPQDIFFHVRSQTGAHVIVRLGRGEVCPPESMLDAATLAAHFSEARNDERAEVSYCERRYVRKPRGAAAGAVTLTKEKVIHLRLEPSRLQRLLASKRAV